MTNLENYFGIKFFVYKQLDPFVITKIKEKAIDISTLIGFNVEDFFVYIHIISILKRTNHFSKNVPLIKKLDKLEVEFSVNPTQIKKGQVKFFNAYVSHDNETGIQELYNDFSLTRIYSSDNLENNNWLETTLITYIKKDLIKKYRKIKINVKAIPTKEFENVLAKKGLCLTQIDLNLEEKIKLNLKNLKPEEIEIVRKSIYDLGKNKIMDNDNKNVFNNNPVIHAEKVIANFATGESVKQTLSNTVLNKQEQVYEELKKLGIDQSEITELKKLIAKKDNCPIHKKIINWVGKVTQKAIDKGIELQVPLLMEKINDLI